MIFNFKIDKCIYYKCYKDIYANKSVISNCVKTCSDGILRADQFVKNSVDQFVYNFD